MKRLVGMFVFLVACSSSGGNDAGTDAPISPACMEATTYQNLVNIENKIFAGSCTFSGCHNGGATDAGMTDMRAGKSFAALVNQNVRNVPGETTRKLVVPGDPKSSYILVMIGQIKPADATPPANDPPMAIGLMPQNAGGQLICPEKRAAIERWIMAGAMNN